MSQNEFDYNAEIKKIRKRVARINRLQNMANRLSRGIVGMRNNFMIIQQQIGNIGNTLNLDDASDVANRMQKLSEQYRMIEVIMIKKYSAIGGALDSIIKVEKEYVENTVKTLNRIRSQQENFVNKNLKNS